MIPALAALALAAGSILCGTVANAQINLLANPGAETGNYNGWSQYNNAGYNFNILTTPTHSGNDSFKIFGDYNIGGADIFNGMFQTFPAHAGQVFTADGWIFQSSGDAFTAGNNTAFLEVSFMDSGNNTIARFRSTIIAQPGFTEDTWQDLFVTNQYDPNTFQFIGTVTNIVAPANTASVEYNVVFDLHNASGGSIYLDDLSLTSFAPPPPYITNMSPTVILATNNNLTFGAVAQSGTITNIQVTVIASTNMVNPTITTNVYDTTTPALTISGLNTASANVSLPLNSNTTYNVTIKVTDSNQDVASANNNFDTLRPVLVWEAEDFNFNGGQFIDTTPDGGSYVYAGMVGTEGTDEHKSGGFNGGQPHNYRPSDAVSTGDAAEIGGARQKFLVSGQADEEVGYNSVGDWLNYTRTFPDGNYNIYARLATVGGGTQVSLAQVTSDRTMPNQTTTNLGTFTFSDNNWNIYQYVPLADSFGNAISVHLSGAQTLRETIVGNPNINFFMIVPAVGSQKPALVSSYPTGAHPFEPTNHLAFTIGPASGSAINSGNIHLHLNGLDMTSQLSIASGAGGTWNCSLPIGSNKIYSATIDVTNNTSLSSRFPINFDTFTQNNFMWEAEDFDFNGGQFIDNPQPSGDTTITSGTATGTPEANSYYFYPGGNSANVSVYGVDFTTQASADGGNHNYRPFDDAGTEVTADYLRQKFVDAQTALSDPNVGDFDLGWWNGGWWLNYTRTYPSGQYYVYGRLAGGNGAFNGTTLSRITSGGGTTNTNVLGSFADPGANGWQSWHWVPLFDTNNRPAIISLSGVTTLRATSGNNLNANFFMLTQAVPPLTLKASVSGGHPAISFATQTGSDYILLYKNNLSDASWTVQSITVGDGTTKTVTDTTGGGQRFYKVLVQ